MTRDHDQMWEVREPNGRLVAEAVDIDGARLAVRTLVAESTRPGYRVGIYAPAHLTMRWAMGLIR